MSRYFKQRKEELTRFSKLDWLYIGVSVLAIIGVLANLAQLSIATQQAQALEARYYLEGNN